MAGRVLLGMPSTGGSLLLLFLLALPAAGEVTATTVYRSNQEWCREGEQASPDTGWCLQTPVRDLAPMSKVTARKDCKGILCASLECPQSTACRDAMKHTLADLQDLYNTDQRRLCGCLGSGFVLKENELGDLVCVTSPTFDSVMANSFDVAANTVSYKYQTCDMLVKCTQIAVFDLAKHFDRYPAVCDEYRDCVMDRQIALATLCNDPSYSLIDSTGKTCPVGQKRAFCTAFADMARCTKCPGSLPDSPGATPPENVCADYYACTNGSTAATCFRQKGTFCPDLDNVAANQPPADDVPHILHESNVCAVCESGDPFKLYCYNQSHCHPVDSWSECTAHCADVRCPTSRQCLSAISEVREGWLDEHRKDMLRLCECLGEGFAVKEVPGSLAVCTHTATSSPWNVYVQQGNTRKYLHVTCSQLSRCQGVSALDSAKYHTYLPEKCSDFRQCVYNREAGFSVHCKDLHFIDTSGESCIDEVTNVYCDKTLIALHCQECPGGTNDTYQVCSLRNNTCLNGTAEDECKALRGFYCPHLTSDDTLPPGSYIAHHPIPAPVVVRSVAGWSLVLIIGLVLLAAGWHHFFRRQQSFPQPIDEPTNKDDGTEMGVYHQTV